VSKSAALSASPNQVLAFRLGSHHLDARLPSGPSAAAALLDAAGASGLQNTPPGSAALALHARVAGLAPQDVYSALEDEKTLLQAWSLRAAPYVFPTRDAALFTLGILPDSETSIRHFITGVEPALERIDISAVDVLDLTASAVVEVLDGRRLTKDELGIELASRVLPRLTARQQVPWQSPSLYAATQSLGESVVRFMLPITALRGLCCHAQRRANQALIARTDQWLGSDHLIGTDRQIVTPPVLSREQAGSELARRYLRCYGPSSLQHFAEWVAGPVRSSGSLSSQSARAWRQLEPDLLPVDFAGRECWIHSADLERFLTPQPSNSARLLPPHDPYLQLRDRDTLVPEKSLQRRLWKTSGNPGVVLVDGQLVAAWRPEKKGRRLALSIEVFRQVSAEARRQIEQEAQSLAPFRDVETVEVRWQDPRGNL